MLVFVQYAMEERMIQFSLSEVSKDCLGIKIVFSKLSVRIHSVGNNLIQQILHFLLPLQLNQLNTLILLRAFNMSLTIFHTKSVAHCT